VDEHSLDVETLLRQRGWLRRLAHGLVREGEVDDLVQQSWLEALGGGSRPRRTLRAWFAGILRNVARRGGADALRPGELLDEPRDEGALGSAELVARAELQERVSSAVRALREPYRTTVLLHYFEGLSLEDLSRRMGVPSSTGRTRLARALAELRARLDHEFGGREAWALTLVGAPALGGGALTGGMVLGTKLKLAGAALIAVLGGYALWRGMESSAGDPARIGEVVAPRQDAAPAWAKASAGASVARTAPEQREALAAAAPAAGSVSDVLLYGSALEPAGARVALSIVWLQDDEGSTRTSSGSAAGAWSIAGLHAGRWRLGARADGHVELHEELSISGAKAHERHDLVLAPALSIRITLADETEKRLPGPYDHEADLPSVTVVATLAPPRDGLGGASGMDAALRGAGTYHARSTFEPMPELPAGCSGLLELRAPLPVYVSAVVQDAVLETRRVDAPVEELRFTIERARLEAKLGGLTLRLIDAGTGAPITGAGPGQGPANGMVQLGLPSGGGAYATPDADGRVMFARQAPGLHELELFRKGYERVEKTVRVPSGGVADLGDFALAPAATIRGRVVDARGAPVNGHLTWISVAHLELPLDSDTRYTTNTLDEGRFEITDAARGPVLLRLAGDEHTLAVQRVDASSGLVEGVVVRVEEGTGVTFRAASECQVTLADEHGLPLTTWRMGPGDVERRLLPAGPYQLCTGADERVEHVEPLTVGQQPLAVELGAAGSR
jgi:RNA polymerase sigma-70 factor (ECF subfamily)